VGLSNVLGELPISLTLLVELSGLGSQVPPWSSWATACVPLASSPNAPRMSAGRRTRCMGCAPVFREGRGSRLDGRYFLKLAGRGTLSGVCHAGGAEAPPAWQICLAGEANAPLAWQTHVVNSSA
jgi:hypothetical protein